MMSPTSPPKSPQAGVLGNIKDSAVFDEIDADGSGDITEVELFDWLKKNNVNVDLGAATAIIQFFDIDGDGNVTFEEVQEKSRGSRLNAGMRVLPTGIQEHVPSNTHQPERGEVQLRRKRTLKKKKKVVHFLGK